MWSFSEKNERFNVAFNKCLNPCFVGMWSFSAELINIEKASHVVLILVLLGCGLLVVPEGFYALVYVEVLILVLLGCGLLVIQDKNIKFTLKESLNPCFVGMWSFRTL